MGFLDFFGDLIGIGASKANAEDTNETNLQIARETNQANAEINQANIDLAKEMYERQEAYNREIYQDQKAYNSASAQRQRLEEAGLNPYMMMSGGSAGSASSSTAPSFSVPQQIPMQSARVNPTVDGNLIRQAVSDINDISLQDSQKRKVDEETRGLGIQNDYLEASNQLDILSKILSLDGLSQDNKTKYIDNYIKQNTSEYAVQSAKYDTEYKWQMIRNASMDYMCKEAGLPYIAPLAQSQLDTMAQQRLTEMVKRQEIRKGMELTDATIAKVYADTLYTNKLRLNMPNLTREQCDALGKALVNSATTAATNAGITGETLTEDLKLKRDETAVPSWIRVIGKAQNQYLLPWFNAVTGAGSKVGSLLIPK